VATVCDIQEKVKAVLIEALNVDEDEVAASRSRRCIEWTVSAARSRFLIG